MEEVLGTEDRIHSHPSTVLLLHLNPQGLRHSDLLGRLHIVGYVLYGDHHCRKKVSSDLRRVA